MSIMTKLLKILCSKFPNSESHVLRPFVNLPTEKQKSLILLRLIVQLNRKVLCTTSHFQSKEIGNFQNSIIKNQFLISHSSVLYFILKCTSIIFCVTKSALDI